MFPRQVQVTESRKKHFSLKRLKVPPNQIFAWSTTMEKSARPNSIVHWHFCYKNNISARARQGRWYRLEGQLDISLIRDLTNLWKVLSMVCFSLFSP